jgi:predicted enzyme related to lactoylglutathione lyase
MATMINWFEIPVSDFERAKKFYETVLSVEITVQEMGGIMMGFFGNPMEPGIAGSICKGEWYTPSADGALVYLTGGDDLSGPLSKVEAAGGKVLMPKTLINDNSGSMAMFLDTEGNRLAFHSPH